MKKFVFVFLLLSSVVFSQENKLFGIDITNFSTVGWNVKEDEPSVFVKYDVKVFDFVYYSPKYKSFSFICNNPTGLVLYEVYNTLKLSFGIESMNVDYIPSEIKDNELNTPENIVRYVSQNKAKISRFWFLENYDIDFEYNNKEFILIFFSK